MDPSRVGQVAIPIPAEQAPPFRSQGRLVAVTGRMTASTPVGDNMFIKPGPYLVVRRETEVYSWVQHELRGQTPGAVGQPPSVTGYEYDQRWSANPQDSTVFQEPLGHENPEPTVEKGQYFPATVTLGRYQFSPKGMDLPVPSTPLTLNPAVVNLNERGQLVGDYIYYRSANPLSPKAGDIRLFYYAVPVDGEITVFGKLEGTRIVPFNGQAGGLFRLVLGGNHDQLAAVRRDFFAAQWRDRAAAFVLLVLTYGLVLWSRRRLPLIVVTAGAAALAVVTVGSSFLLAGPLAAPAVFGLGLLVIFWAGRSKPKKKRKTARRPRVTPPPAETPSLPEE